METVEIIGPMLKLNLYLYNTYMGGIRPHRIIIDISKGIQLKVHIGARGGFHGFDIIADGKTEDFGRKHGQLFELLKEELQKNKIGFKIEEEMAEGSAYI